MHGTVVGLAQAVSPSPAFPVSCDRPASCRILPNMPASSPQPSSRPRSFPFQSEAVLFAMLVAEHYPWWLLILVASVGNILGSIVNWFLGRFFAHFEGRRWFPVKREQMAQGRGLVSSLRALDPAAELVADHRRSADHRRRRAAGAPAGVRSAGRARQDRALSRGRGPEPRVDLGPLHARPDLLQMPRPEHRAGGGPDDGFHPAGGSLFMAQWTASRRVANSLTSLGWPWPAVPMGSYCRWAGASSSSFVSMSRSCLLSGCLSKTTFFRLKAFQSGVSGLGLQPSAIPLRQCRRDHKEWHFFLQLAQFQLNKTRNLRGNHASLSFSHHHPWPQHGRRPRPLAGHGHEGCRFRQADHRRGELLHPVRAGPRPPQGSRPAGGAGDREGRRRRQGIQHHRGR